MLPKRSGSGYFYIKLDDDDTESVNLKPPNTVFQAVRLWCLCCIFSQTSNNQWYVFRTITSVMLRTVYNVGWTLLCALLGGVCTFFSHRSGIPESQQTCLPCTPAFFSVFPSWWKDRTLLNLRVYLLTSISHNMGGMNK